MKTTERSKLKKALEELHALLTKKENRRIDPNRAGEGEVVDEDQQALNEMLQSIASNRNRNDNVLLARVERALAKLRDDPDAFGACDECGEDIALARLRAMPYAELCVHCQAKRDPARGTTRRRVTDYT